MDSRRLNLDNLEKNILATLSYFNVLDWPLTDFEIYRYLIKEHSVKELDFRDVRESSERLECRDIICRKRGFYYLSGSGIKVEKRVAREKETLRKWLLAKKRMKFLRNLPFLRAVFLSGSVAVGNARKASDIDLLVVAEKGRIWIVRFMLHFILALLGWRRHGEKLKDRLCLNHFLTIDDLHIPFKNIYNAQTYAHFLCLVDDNNYFLSFFEQNRWIDNYLYQGRAFHKIKKTCSGVGASRAQRLLEFLTVNWLADRIESILGWLQKRKIASKHRRMTDERILVRENQLAFHPRKKEKRIVERYRDKLNQLGIN